MRKITTLLTTLVLILSLVVCVVPTSAAEGGTVPETVAFNDPVLEAMVRAAMGKPDGAITVAEAEAVTKLDLSFEWQQYVSGATPIESIGGLEHFKNLESLDLSLNEIADITPLASLTKLKILVLSGNPVTDITPLHALSALKVLVMSDCAAQDYSPLANLTSLEYLALERSTIADATPLASLTNLKRLYLEGCDLDYAPIANIYPALEDRDFVILPAPSSLAELGFVMDGDGKQAVFDSEQVSVRINHIEWGTPTAMGAENCIRTVFGTDKYKVDIGYYPEHDTYVVQAYKDSDFVLNYLYFCAENSFGEIDRQSLENVVREIFPDVDGDVLLAPIDFHIAALDDAFGMTAAELFALPFEQSNDGGDATVAATVAEGSLAWLGFDLDEAGVCAVYEDREPHYKSIAIARPEWGEFDSDWNIEFIDTDINGYSLRITYHASEGEYLISLEKDGVGCSYQYYPATDDKGWEEPDLDTVHRMFNDALGTKEKELYYVPLEQFEQYVHERFGMSVDELYALPRY
ncbi:leucine-rich repeat domain-containing protein [Bacillota bacterium Meth-B3]